MACVATCPDGTIANANTLKCDGCASFCKICDYLDQRKCYTCNKPYLVYNNTCLRECPSGYRKNFDETACIANVVTPPVITPPSPSNPQKNDTNTTPEPIIVYNGTNVTTYVEKPYIIP